VFAAVGTFQEWNLLNPGQAVQMHCKVQALPGTGILPIPVRGVEPKCSLVTRDPMVRNVSRSRVRQWQTLEKPHEAAQAIGGGNRLCRQNPPGGAGPLFPTGGGKPCKGANYSPVKRRVAMARSFIPLSALAFSGGLFLRGGLPVREVTTAGVLVGFLTACRRRGI